MTRPSARSSSSSSSLRKRLDVFDFTEEDERVEKASQKFLGRFGNPKKPKIYPLTKYKFLECFARGTKTLPKEISYAPIDIDAGGIAAQETKTTQKEVAVAAQRIKTPQKEIDNGLLDVDASYMGHQFSYSSSYPMEASLQDGAVRGKTSGLDALLPSTSSNFKNEGACMVSDNDDRIEMCSSSTSALIPTIDEALIASEEQASEYGSGGYEIDNVNMTVNVFPDFILYGDIYCTKSQLTFSKSCIKLEGSTVNGLKETFSFEWAIGFITKIKSEWCGTVETAVVNLFLRSEDSKEGGNANETSAIEQLKFAVYDPHWSKGERAIKSLDARYKNIWNVIFDIDTGREDNALLGQNSMFLSKHYFSVFDKPFEDVVYPKGDPDAVSISTGDVELLQPERFINDTIIDFYIKYLKNKIQPGEKHRYHFFNSFFFRKLADLDKDPSSAYEGRAAFERVRKWTRKVNLFGRDYIFIPVNYSLHWSLIVICHLREVAKFKDEEVENLPKVPCVLHMDSIRGSHRGLKNLVRSYLCEEWKEKHGEIAADVSSKFLHLRFVSLELPQQENLFDCGLFLLHYVELFLEEAPINFNPFQITKFSKFLNRNWFPPEEASLKRARIRKLICEILEDHSQKAPLPDYDENYPPSQLPQLPDSNMQETGAKFEQTYVLTKLCHGNSSGSNDQARLEVSFISVSPPKDVQCFRDSGLVLREFFEPGTIARSFADVKYQQIADHHLRSIMSPIEEDEETGTSISGPQYSSVGAYKDQQLPETDEVNHLEKAYKPQCYSTSSEELMACVVEDSVEANSKQDGDESKSCPSFQGNILTLSHQEVDSIENVNVIRKQYAKEQ